MPQSLHMPSSPIKSRANSSGLTLAARTIAGTSDSVNKAYPQRPLETVSCQRYSGSGWFGGAGAGDLDVLLIVILKCKCGHECDMWHVHDSTACTQYKPILQLKPEDSVGPAGGDSSILREPHRSSSRGRETTSIGQHKEGFQISCRETPSLLLSPGPGPARSGQWPSFVNRIEESEHCTAKRQEQVVNMHTMCKACDMDSDSDMCTTAKHVLKTNLSCS